MDQTLVKRLFELRFEIQELEREGRQYVAKAHPSPYERLLQDKRIRRLEDIKSELERASRPATFAQTIQIDRRG